MSSETNTISTGGLHGSAGWLVGGALGGALGAAAFGLLLWAFDPGLVEAAIPAIYGLEATGLVGWAIHLAHGVALGLAFGLLVTRGPVLSVLRTDVETDALAATGPALRIIGAGFVYGLTVVAILPLLVLPVWAGTMGGTAADFPGAAIESLLGHLLFGLVLGTVFAATVDLRGLSPDR